MTTPVQFAQALLAKLGMPITSNNVEALVAAQAIEGGFMHNGALYNPLNTTQPMPGSSSVTSVKVQAYTSWEEGLSATAKTLTNGLYKGILTNLAASSPPDVTLHAMALSPWGWYQVDASGNRTVSNAIGPAAGYQGYGSQSFPPGGGGLWVLGGSTLGLAFAAIAGGLYAWAHKWV